MNKTSCNNRLYFANFKIIQSKKIYIYKIFYLKIIKLKLFKKIYLFFSKSGSK